jgi:VWFA-related protein
MWQLRFETYSGVLVPRHSIPFTKCILLAVVLALPCFSQDSSPSPQEAPITTLRATSRLVVLDVVVTDRSGKPASPLSKDDFTILEDGKPQTIASFESPEAHKYAIPKLDAQQTDRRTQSVSSALTILVIDGLNTPLVDQAYAREAVVKFLRSHGPKLTQPTSLMLVTDTRLELVHDYTQDAGALLDALKRNKAELPFRYGANDYALGETERLLDTLSCLERIAAANMNYAGRKNVVWIGQGFPFLNFSRMGATRGPSIESDYQHRLIRLGSDTANEMWNARLAIYTIDPRGLQVNSAGANSAQPPQTDSPTLVDDPTGLRLFESIASETGGKITFNRNDVDVAVADSVNDGSFYYTLSYYPSNRNWNGKFRNIKVAISKPSVQARTRTGYYAAPDAPDSDATLDSVLASAVKNPLPYRGLAMSVSFKILPGSPRTARFTVAADRHDLGWETMPNCDHRCQIMLVAMSVSRKERVAKTDIKALEGIVKAGKFEKQMEKPMLFTFTGDLPVDAVRLRVVVRDDKTGNIGTEDLSTSESRMARAN